MDNDSLKGCPHCGGPGSIWANYSYKTRSYFVFVKCGLCGAQGKVFTSDNDPEEEGWNNVACNNAVMAWNLRFDSSGSRKE